MATLQDKLDTIKRSFESQAPEEARSIMHRATADLIASGLAERALGEGAQAPAFELQDTAGQVLQSADLLSRGPLVVTFFRGHW